jgi:hypothetical protein
MHVLHGGVSRRSRAKVRWVLSSLVVVLWLCFFSGGVYAGWVGCVQAWLDGENAVRLLVKADEKGTAKFTIGENVIRFAVHANVQLDTGRLRLHDAELVVVELSNVDDAVTARCEIAVAQLTNQPAGFCCDRLPPVVNLAVEGGDGGAVVGWEITDASSGVSQCRVVLIVDGVEHALSSDCSGSRTIMVGEYPEGTHEVRAWAVDHEGNEASVSEDVLLQCLTCSVSGQVVDATTGEPISGVTVTLDTGDVRTTDAQGRFVFSSAPSGKHYYSFAKGDEYEGYSTSVTCRNGQPRSITVSLVPISVARVELSWTENPADSGREKTVHVDDPLFLYVTVPNGAEYYIGFDAASNDQEPRAVFSGIELGLSMWMKTLPSHLCQGCVCEASPWNIVIDCDDYIVHFQAVAILPDGSVMISDVLTLTIDLI